MRAKRGAAAFAAVIGAAGTLAAAAAVSGTTAANAGTGGGSVHGLIPGNLLISESYYLPDNNLVAGKTVLPPGCTSGCAVAIAAGTYPQVFNNDSVDDSFGVSSKVFLDQITQAGKFVNRTSVPESDLVTSFSSKSELALNLSPDGKYVTFMGYAAPQDTLDVSNANTPGAVDPTNPVGTSYYRVVAQLAADGKFQFTETNAYSGNNGRAAVAVDVNGKELIYAAGNAGNGSTPEPSNVILGAGAQLITPSTKEEVHQKPGTPTPVGSFSVTQLGDKADKVGKDDNFRGLALYNNVLYFTKGSGGNGVNTVYFLDTTGKACPDGVGLPEPNAPLPAAALAYSASTLQADGLPSNMCILKGFPTALKSATAFPFGLWFANPDTLYVADEGNGTDTYAGGVYTAAAAQTTAGLQKWVFSGGQWNLAYTLSAGLGLGQPYTVVGYPTGVNPVTGLPWSPATDGLRNITGRVNPNGTVTIWAITSTVSGGGDQGADPNRLVVITDRLSAASGAGESFRVLRAAGYGEVLRGISFTPGTTAAYIW
jgi:hypothetical protein